MQSIILKKAIERREKTLSILKGPKFEEIKSEAKKNWIDYKPKKEQSSIAGIDSSYNTRKFQGAEMWAITAISTKTDGKIISEYHDFGLGNPEFDFQSMSTRMENKACKESIDNVDLVLMDGSLYSQFIKKQINDSDDSILKIIKKRDNVIFISKTSDTKKQFKNSGSVAGDIFYYNHATIKPGFSKIFQDDSYGSDRIISLSYVRLNDSLPLIKIEMLGNDCTEPELKTLLNKLYGNSIGGYPYALKLAHNICKISDKDMEKLIRLHGLTTEIGAREVLE